MAVLVMDGEQRSSLAVVRSLGSRGIEVDVAAASEASLAGVSRYASSQVSAPSPTRDPRGFQEWFTEVAAQSGYEMLLPMTDASVNLVTQVIGEDVIDARIPLPSHRVCMAIQDKGLVMRIAQQVGVPIPATWQPGSEAELNEVLTKISFPVVIKPRFSARLEGGDHWVRGPVTYAHSADELRTAFSQSLEEGFAPLIQEMIYGEGRGVFLFVWKGELKAAFCHRRLREKPPWGGVSVLRDSVPYDAQLVDQSFRLLQALGWDRGAAMVEYKRDRRDNRLKLMEINGRFWGSLQLAIDAGMDIPAMAYQAIRGENVAKQTDYRVGTVSRWLLGDLDHLLISLRKRTAWDNDGKPLAKSRVLREFLTTFGTKNEIARWNDMQPAMLELKDYVRSLTR
jgi:predicted ATP-grasp superfamily ATP-dependent carboligase